MLFYGRDQIDRRLRRNFSSDIQIEFICIGKNQLQSLVSPCTYDRRVLHWNTCMYI